MVVLTSAVARPAARPLTCILDARLMLEPLGLVLACRLARQVETWLVRRLWSLLDNDAFYQRWPRELAGDCTSDEARHLATWRAAWLEGQLNQRFYWVGDARYESVLPPDVDVSIRDRLDRLVAELDPPADEASAPHLGVLEHCARDALALAAALANDNPVIFTTRREQHTPPLVDLAERFGVFEIVSPRRNEVDLIPESLQRIAAPLVPFGLDIVAVHVIAPAATVMVDRPSDGEAWESDSEVAPRHWSQARLAWQTLSRGAP